MRNLILWTSLFTVVACSQNDFTGKGKKKEAEAPAATATPMPQQPVAPVTPVQPVPQQPITPGVVPTPLPPASPLTPWQTIAGFFSGLVQKIKDLELDSSDNEITYGRAKVFHIGDKQFSSSNCKLFLIPYFTKGTKYMFQFEVRPNTQGTTSVQIDIQRICGVDYGDSNFAWVQDATGRKIEEKLIPKGAESLAFSPMSLPAGMYAVVVESRLGSAQDQSGNDRDDFIVGKVHILATGPVKPGEVGALP